MDEALFTAPAHSNWGGAAVLNQQGELCGIGSLMIQESSEEDAPGGNMIVPIDLFKPIFPDLLKYGRANRPPRPWLGMMATEIKGALVVVGLVEQGPAERADIRVGDLILEVAGEPVKELAEMFRCIWALGTAGVEVSFKLVRSGSLTEVKVQSVNRYDVLKSPNLH